MERRGTASEFGNQKSIKKATQRELFEQLFYKLSGRSGLKGKMNIAGTIIRTERWELESLEQGILKSSSAQVVPAMALHQSETTLET